MPQPLTVPPGEPIVLAQFDAAYRGERNKKEAKAALPALTNRINELQDMLYADGRYAVLVVLQGMDTAGKDSTIRRVFRDVGPLGCHAVSFGIPSEEELEHDFLWRYHRQAPRRRQLFIFNRSHYESVLVERVKNITPPDVWKTRYSQINAFEAMLTAERTIILKFFLYLSRDEQRLRLQARLDKPDKRWKFRRGDLEDRKLWDDYVRAYEDALTHCNTEWAPWHIVPADRKWYRDIVVAHAIVDELERLNLHYPEPVEDLSGLVVE